MKLHIEIIVKTDVPGTQRIKIIVETDVVEIPCIEIIVNTDMIATSYIKIIVHTVVFHAQILYLTFLHVFFQWVFNFVCPPHCKNLRV